MTEVLKNPVIMRVFPLFPPVTFVPDVCPLCDRIVTNEDMGGQAMNMLPIRSEWKRRIKRAERQKREQKAAGKAKGKAKKQTIEK
ncbi:hypothetical protein SPTER_27490 [Sporomusa termitida]|uniref:Uncharacterized protein n=1 Tax=Sporomusa termitida TaxID=2377 RepID=A0A517DVH8_9FIRM|nr:hypothetical protein SPTER_27490 [Sporomusa termitida]